MNIDLRNDIEFSLIVTKTVEKPNSIFSKMELKGLLNNEEIGFILFDVVESDEQKLQRIEIDIVQVYEKFQNIGVGTKLYEELGKMYLERWDNYPIYRYFVNPVAEYAFKKAVSLGLVPENMLTNTHTTSRYDNEKNIIWQDLRKKLPEKYQSKRS